MTRNLFVQSDRIAADIDALAALTEPGRPWTRRAFTPMFLTGRAYVERAMQAAGLETRVDAAGNLIGRRAGRDGSKGTIAVGSHSDTVPDGGRFDGIAGVVTGIEIARALADRGIVLDHDLEIIDCLAEEVSIFGVSCVGSRSIAGVLPIDWLARENDGQTLSDAIAAVGGDADRLATAKRTDLRAFLELHIEQGPVLEAAAEDVGIVTTIAGITRIEIELAGRADHAGTTPMGGRADALVAAADVILAIRALGSTRAATSNGHFAATVGEFRIEPNAANVVPSLARLLIDARAELRPDMEAFLVDLEASANEIAARHGVRLAGCRVISDSRPTPSDPALLGLLTDAANALGIGHRPMASGAGHDMAWFAKVAPAAMVFVPCREGRSHSADEWAETDAIALGAEVLLQTVLAIDRG
jgi:N-carbamoyl-L-amino-acid hydrolase